MRREEDSLNGCGDRVSRHDHESASLSSLASVTRGLLLTIRYTVLHEFHLVSDIRENINEGGRSGSDAGEG